MVRWLAECGNGVVEGYEECDVGNTAGGNGCSKECIIEEGYQCTATSPSVCARLPPGQHTQHPERCDLQSLVLTATACMPAVSQIGGHRATNVKRTQGASGFLGGILAFDHLHLNDR